MQGYTKDKQPTFIHSNYIHYYNNYSTTPKAAHMHNLYLMQCNNDSIYACGTNSTKVIHTIRVPTSEPKALTFELQALTSELETSH